MSAPTLGQRILRETTRFAGIQVISALLLAGSNLILARLLEPHAFGADDDGTMYLVMELLRGEDLGAVITQRGRLAAAEVVDLLAQADAVDDISTRLGSHRKAAVDVPRVRAEGRVIHCGRQLATAEARLVGPDGGQRRRSGRAGARPRAGAAPVRAARLRNFVGAVRNSRMVV